MTVIGIRTRARSDIVDITPHVEALVEQASLSEGVVVLQSLHTTAGLTINENADPDVKRDIVEKLNRLIPRDEPFYQHVEGNSDSHLKTSFFGPSLTVLVDGGRLVLGSWQGVFLCEFDGPRDRQVAVQLLSAG
jgi:secondary thiamine-phosphate synthase enzyme